MNQIQENSQQAIDARIKALEVSIEEPVWVLKSRLKYERNALAPISSLPPEVFAIFSFSCSSGKPDDNLTQIHLSHVCHQWREIALSQPLLWSHVDFTTLSSAGAAETLARAKSSPLYLEARISSQSWNDVRFNRFLKEVQAPLPRICHLCVSAEGPDIHSILRALGLPVPVLEYLSIFSTTWMKTVLIPDTLFDGSAPRLSSCLTLCHCGISWKWSPLRGLKYLEILKPAALNSRLKLAVWLDALAEMLELKALILQWASPHAPPFPFDVERTVTLPSLEHFNIMGHLEHCVLALAHLDLPVLTQLSHKAICYLFTNSDDVRELLPYVVRYIYGTQHTQPWQSMLIGNNDSYVDLHAWAVPDIGVEVHEFDPPTLPDATLAPRLALSFTCDDKTDSHCCNHLALLRYSIPGLPLDGIVTLAAQDLCNRSRLGHHVSSKQFWLHIPYFAKVFPASACEIVTFYSDWIYRDAARR